MPSHERTESVRHRKHSFERTRVPVSKFNFEYKGGFGSPEVWTCDVPVRGGGEGHKGICKDFTSAIVKGTPLLAKGEEGINGLQLSNAMLLSAWTDAWVDLPVDDELFYSKLKETIDSSTFKKEASGKSMDVEGSF